MSVTYGILCLSHDPSVIAKYGYVRALDAERAILAGVEGHLNCDLVMGNWHAALTEVGCPATSASPGPHPCGHSSPEWVGADWLRLLALAQQQPAGTDLRDAASAAAGLCWPAGRLHRLRRELGVPPRPVVATGELCGNPGPAANDPSNPCTLPLGHDMHRDQDGCSWSTPVAEVVVDRSSDAADHTTAAGPQRELCLSRFKSSGRVWRCALDRNHTPMHFDGTGTMTWLTDALGAYTEQAETAGGAG